MDRFWGPSKKPRLNDDASSRVLCGSLTGAEQEQEPVFSLFDFVTRHELKADGIEVENIIKERKGSYILIFKTNEGMLKALGKGTWAIGDVKIVLKGWGPKPAKGDSCLVWIKIHDMPLGLWKLDVVEVMSSVFGIIKEVDRPTRRMCKDGSLTVTYARVLVDMGTISSDDVVDGISVSYPSGDGYLLSDLRIECAYKCSFCKVNDHLDWICKARIVKEAEDAKKRKEMLLKEDEEEEEEWMEEQGGDTTIKVAVACDEDLLKQIGKDIYFDLVDHEKVWSILVESKKSFHSVKEEVARAFNVPVENQRFWTWAKRQNQTYRPYRPLIPMEEAKSVGQLRVDYNNNNKTEAELNLFLETAFGPDLLFCPPPHIREEDILVFFKLYEPADSQLRYVCRLFVRSSGNPTEIISHLKEKVGFSPNEEIQLFEEVKSERYHEQEIDPCVMCQLLDETASFGSSQIKNGDIICFQKPSKDCDKYPYPDLPSFLEHAKNIQVVHFRNKDKPKEEAFSLNLSKFHTYDDLAGEVAKKLAVNDPSTIRFTAHNSTFYHPECALPIDYQVEGHLLDMLGDCNEGYNILYYEVFDIPLPELEDQIILKVPFYHATTYKKEPVIYNIRLPEQSTVGDFLTEINGKVNACVSYPDAAIRLLQINHHTIYKVFKPTERILDIDDVFGTVRAEKIPEEEKVLRPGDQCIHVYHFNKEAEQNRPQQLKNFGEPFFLVIREDENLAAVKLRIRLKLEVPDDEFSKWKFAVVYRTNPEYLQDSDIVFSLFQRTMYADSELPYFGLEHLP